MPTPPRLSLLDRSRTRVGEPDGIALHRTVARARRCEELGYHRFWVAEHHGVPGVASGSPAVLLAAIGAATARIRIGSGGVMLPNHAPLVVAEQFLVLAGLHPGRVDLGVGRSLGFTAAVRRALRADSEAAVRFAEDLTELRAYLSGDGPITARPAVDPPPPVFVLAMTRGLEIAAAAGLPAVVGGPALRDIEALQRYRDAVGPDVPLIVSADIVIADSRERARELLLPEAWAMVRSRETGVFAPLEPVETVLAQSPTARQRERIEAWLAGTIHGTADEVAEQLHDLLDRTGAEEVMATTSTYADADRDAADAALAEVMARVG